MLHAAATAVLAHIESRSSLRMTAESIRAESAADDSNIRAALEKGHWTARCEGLLRAVDIPEYNF
jgi:hypothetical protein